MFFFLSPIGFGFIPDNSGWFRITTVAVRALLPPEPSLPVTGSLYEKTEKLL
jgi:hypothetical protein